MILLDTETTGLPDISVADLSRQPYIIELGAMRIDDSTLEELARITFLCNPGVPLPAKITEITGLTDADLAGQPPFIARYQDLCNFFLGERTLVAHNLSFDRALLSFELHRIGRHEQFPWPPEHICTVECSIDIKGYRLSLTDLYIHYYGVNPGQKHRGMGDVDILHNVVRAMRREGRL